VSTAPLRSDAPGYRALRGDVGAAWTERDFLSVDGPDAATWLQGQLSQDLEAVGEGGSADALLLSPQGKLEALVRVTRRHPDSFLLDVEGGFGERVRGRLERFKLRVKAEITDLPWRCLSLRGPGSGAAAASVASVEPPWLALSADWPGLAGVDLAGTAATVPGGVVMCGPAEWEAARVEAGIPRMGVELDDRTIPVEAGLNERAVSLTKGCYTGQELVARLEARGNKVARRLRGITLEGSDPPPPGAAVLLPAEDKTVGTVTSSAFSPSLGEAVALAYVRREVAVAAEVIVRWDETESPARVRELPLVR
jgi:folate-binding protein YgfZ